MKAYKTGPDSMLFLLTENITVLTNIQFSSFKRWEKTLNSYMPSLTTTGPDTLEPHAGNLQSRIRSVQW